MVSAVSAQGNRPYARFVCRRGSFLCLILRLATRLPRLPRSSRGAQSRGHSPLSFSRTIFPCNPFRSNTCRMVWKCSFQKTYRNPKSFRCNTYKKPGGRSDSFIISLLHCIHVRCRPVDAPLERRCFPTEKALYLFSLHIVAGLFPSQRGGVHPLPSLRLALPQNPFSVPRCPCGFPAPPRITQEILCAPFQLCAWPCGLAHRRFSWNVQS